MPSWRIPITILRSLLAIALALAAVVVINLLGGELADWFGLPPGGDGRLAWDLGWVIASGTAAIWVAARAAPRAPRGHALAFFVMLLAAAVWGVVRMGGDYPGWFCAGLVLTLPLQGWVGMKLALLGRRGS
ncbi:hypothetical protein [Luteimonas panaciterrae]|uniref:hypothetical protein n=1 Tax=Luteimonas panaciterrae TaxID=363885 RepID=UPI001CF97A1C|nr:hypothetical protein [Luteimonas panaciterrae]